MISKKNKLNYPDDGQYPYVQYSTRIITDACSACLQYYFSQYGIDTCNYCAQHGACNQSEC